MTLKVAVGPCFILNFFRSDHFFTGCLGFIFYGDDRSGQMIYFSAVPPTVSKRNGNPDKASRQKLFLIYFLRSVIQCIDSLYSRHPSWEKSAFQSADFCESWWHPHGPFEEEAPRIEEPIQSGPLTHSIAGPVGPSYVSLFSYVFY